MKKVLLDTVSEYCQLGIVEELDYAKFYLYSLITHSTAIEGSTVTEVENQLLFDEGLTAKKRTLHEQMMNIDLKNAYLLSHQYAREHRSYSLEMLKELNAAVMKNTGSTYNTILGSFDSAKGDFRKLNVSAGASGRSYLNHTKVESCLNTWCSEINKNRNHFAKDGDIYQKYLFTFDAHFDLVTIHPWVDGNGRTSRLVMNQLQTELCLIPSKVLKEDKAEYIQALINARDESDKAIFSTFMMRSHIKNLQAEISEFKKSKNFPERVQKSNNIER